MKTADTKNQIDGIKRSIKARFRMQDAACTICVSGPSGSGKSYFHTAVLPESSNRLLARNVGMKQTSLIKTKLSLDGNLDYEQVIIRIKVKPFDPLLIKPILIDLMIDFIYENRDDLEDVAVDRKFVTSILDPQNRAYHFATYVERQQEEVKCPSLEVLRGRLQALFEHLILDLADEVKAKEKETKTIYPKPKKKEVYELIINKRLDDTRSQELEADVLAWFGELYNFVQDELLQTCMWLDSDKEYAVVSADVESDQIKTLIRDTYDQHSPYSLVIDELSYLVRPSEAFNDAFLAAYRGEEYLGKSIRLNILDTPGVTQTGESKEHIEDALQRVLGSRFDGFIFVTSTDERPSIYDSCKDLLITNKQKFNGVPMKFLRTKADIKLYETMKRDLLLEKGRSEFTQGEALEYARRAYDELLTEVANENVVLSKALGVEDPLDFISLDFTQMRNLAGSFFEDKPLDKAKLFDILLQISRRVYDAHNPGLGGRRYLQVIEPAEPALVMQVDAETEKMVEDFSKQMVMSNARDYEFNYYKYEAAKKAYHGRSVYTFYDKHKYGSGHETRATVYENFNIHTRSMIQKWMNAFFQGREVKFSVSFSNIRPTEARTLSEQEAPQILQQVFEQQKQLIISRIAIALSYNGLMKEMGELYYRHAADPAFRENLRLFYRKFSSENYWKETFLRYLQIELNQILDRMYFYE